MYKCRYPRAACPYHLCKISQRYKIQFYNTRFYLLLSLSRLVNWCGNEQIILLTCLFRNNTSWSSNGTTRPSPPAVLAIKVKFLHRCRPASLLILSDNLQVCKLTYHYSCPISELDIHKTSPSLFRIVRIYHIF